MNATANEFIKHHSFNDLMSMIGLTGYTEGLHVFTNKAPQTKGAFDYPFRSDHFFIFMVNSGKMHFRLNLIQFELGTNDLIVVAPNAIRQCISMTEDCTLSGLAFTSDFLMHTAIHKKHIDPFDVFAAHGNPHLVLQPEDVVSIKEILLMMKKKNDVAGNSLFGMDIIQHYFAAFIYELAALHKKYNGDVPIKFNRKEDLTMRFLKLLPDHFKEERSVQYYAEQLFVTPKYLTQSVKEITTKTAGVFIDEMVIMEAKVLLNDVSLSVAQVADMLYFSDQFFFSKFFKNHTTVSPTDYRKSL